MHTLKNAIEANIRDCQSTKFDYIVIGSGAAGCASALTLADKGFNILVIEAGPLLLTEHVGSLAIRHSPSILKALCNNCSNYRTWHTDSGISREQVWSVAGGRTLFWGGHAPRFFDFEFSKWPMDFSEIEEDYLWAEKTMHVNDSFFSNATENNFIRKCQNHNVYSQASPLALEHISSKISILPHLFFSSIHGLISHPAFTNSFDQKGIHLICDEVVKKILFQKDQITGIEVCNSITKETNILTANNYILSCGAFHSTKLVIDSKLIISSPVFKTNIGEHLFCKGLIQLNKNIEEPLYIYIPATTKSNFMFELQGPFDMTSYNPNYATVWLDWKTPNRYLLLYGFGVTDVSKKNMIHSVANQQGYQIDYNYSTNDYQTMNSMKNNAEQVASVLEGKLVNFEILPPGNSLHERGGLMMGNNQNNGVVSPDGQFWNYQNLYCTDTAIWPDQGAANSCLSIMAIAHHLMCKQSFRG